MNPISAAGGRSPAMAELHHACREMEAAFTRQLLQAMRETTEDGSEASTEKSFFTSLLDDHLASETARNAPRGLGEALFRQVARRMNEGE